MTSTLEQGESPFRSDPVGGGLEIRRGQGDVVDQRDQTKIDA